MAILHLLRVGLVLTVALAPAAFAQEPAAPETAVPAAPTAPAPVTQEPPTQEPVEGEKLRIVVIGDSLGEGLAPALTDALEDAETLEVQRRARGSSGFVRDDYYNWPKIARDIAAEGPIAAMVMMIGVNDRQTMQIESGRVPPLSDEWRKTYIARVDDLLTTFKNAKAKLYWVGLPPMPTSRVSSDMAALNEIFRDRVNAAGGKFIDIWDGFANDDGRFTAVGPDLAGSIRKLRASDGIHFSRAGYEKLAHFVEQEIRTELAPGTGGEEMAIQEETQPPVEPPPLALAPAPAPDTPQGALSKSLGQAPGPIVPLNGEKSGEPKLISGERKNVAEQAVIHPKPGRADDFHWPR